MTICELFYFILLSYRLLYIIGHHIWRVLWASLHRECVYLIRLHFVFAFIRISSRLCIICWKVFRYSLFHIHELRQSNVMVIDEIIEMAELAITQQRIKSKQYYNKSKQCAKIKSHHSNRRNYLSQTMHFKSIIHPQLRLGRRVERRRSMR